MPDTTLPSNTDLANEITVSESSAPPSELSITEEVLPTQEELLLEDGLEEELIIEDFTIDGICGVY